jgi:hypothetical protein
MFICDTPARAFIQGTKAHNRYTGCRRCIEEGEFINNRMTFPGVDCASQTVGNNLTVIWFKKLVESLNSCQTIVRQKGLIFPYYCMYRHWADNFLKN